MEKFRGLESLALQMADQLSSDLTAVLPIDEWLFSFRNQLYVDQDQYWYW